MKKEKNTEYWCSTRVFLADESRILFGRTPIIGRDEDPALFLKELKAYRICLNDKPFREVKCCKRLTTLRHFF